MTKVEPAPSTASQPDDIPFDPEALAGALEQKVKVRESELEELRRFAKGLEDLIRRMDEKQNWREELDDWVKESQDAQLEAIMSSVGLLLAPAGPLAESVQAQAPTTVSPRRLGRSASTMRRMTTASKPWGQIVRRSNRAVSRESVTRLTCWVGMHFDKACRKLAATRASSRP